MIIQEVLYMTSPMASIYVKMIKDGRRTLKQVEPESLRREVEQLLKKDQSTLQKQYAEGR